ncbi:MAG: hypothetical protein WCL50_09885 [Spirochaetota bacterium]
MNQTSIILSLALSALVATSLAASPAASPAASAWGAKAASADNDLTIPDMLRYAIEDEYLARAEYAAIIEAHGSLAPFSNIVRTEVNHISWLVEAIGRAKLPVPTDEAEALVRVPSNMKEALAAGVEAEIANIAMYDSFLASSPIAAPANAGLRNLFVRLRDASKNHLAAFRNGLAKS